MTFTTDTAHKALTYRLHRRRQTADICRQWGGVTPLHPPPFADAPACMHAHFTCLGTLYIGPSISYSVRWLLNIVYSAILVQNLISSFVQ